MQAGLLKVQAFRVPFTSPMQSVQEPTGGRGGSSAASVQPECTTIAAAKLTRGRLQQERLPLSSHTLSRCTNGNLRAAYNIAFLSKVGLAVILVRLSPEAQRACCRFVWNELEDSTDADVEGRTLPHLTCNRMRLQERPTGYSQVSLAGSTVLSLT